MKLTSQVFLDAQGLLKNHFRREKAMKLDASSFTEACMAQLAQAELPRKSAVNFVHSRETFALLVYSIEPLRVGQSYHHEISDMPETSPAGEVRNPSTLIEGAVVWITTVPLAPITLEKAGAVVSVIAEC